MLARWCWASPSPGAVAVEAEPRAGLWAERGPPRPPAGEHSGPSRNAGHRCPGRGPPCGGGMLRVTCEWERTCGPAGLGPAPAPAAPRGACGRRRPWRLADPGLGAGRLRSQPGPAWIQMSHHSLLGGGADGPFLPSAPTSRPGMEAPISPSLLGRPSQLGAQVSSSSHQVAKALEFQLQHRSF
ncbi:decreased expression in renal and prostate cancer protein-like [Moschus berezovskii]|uniref:decreased expression in renal and prostate cancer protein-like n=1 Tax=Moschus berezovskii TaxID=68408 RepID=UPI002443907B|nr:decreased expression in renal and prostate cancer protein-like [Moschus berezovskii]